MAKTVQTLAALSAGAVAAFWLTTSSAESPNELCKQQCREAETLCLEECAAHENPMECESACRDEAWSCRTSC